MDDHISELPDDILSYIRTMLSIKDLLKTSVLSKRWCKLWFIRRDLHFDIHNVIGSEKELLEKGHLTDVTRYSRTDRCVNLDLTPKEFVKRVDQFFKNFHGSTINSFSVNFYLDCQQSNTIDRWINFAIVRGVEIINLLFLGRPYVHRTTQNKHYKFDSTLFSETNASTLKHLRLEYCLVCHPTNRDFTMFKNLRSLSLSSTKLDEMFIERLLSNCQHLEELCLNDCAFKSSMPKIVSSSLCHLNVVLCYYLFGDGYQSHLNLDIVDCPKLTLLEYIGWHDFDTMELNTPMLKNIDCSISVNELNAFVALCSTVPELEILHVSTYFKVGTSLKITQPLKHLKQLNLMIDNQFIIDDEEYDTLWILNILQDSPLLRKLTIMYANSKFLTNQKDIRDVDMFSHDEVKVIELRGCVGNWFEIEFVMNVLKYAHKLEQIVVSPYWREDDEASEWNHNPVWFHSGCKRMSEKLREVVGLEKLVLI